MALYKAQAKLFVDGRFIYPGVIFDSNDTPGEKWDPVDADAKAATQGRMRRPGLRATAAERQSRELPADWENLPREQIVNLSRRLGAARNNNYSQALAYLTKFEQERDAKRAEAGLPAEGDVEGVDDIAEALNAGTPAEVRQRNADLAQGLPDALEAMEARKKQAQSIAGRSASPDVEMQREEKR